MKTSILLTVAVLLLSGCISASKSADDFKIIQAALNVVLPPGFEGDLEGAHDGYYFGTSVHLEFDLKGLHQVGGRWTWASGGYKRKGFFSQGAITLTPKKGE